MTDATIENRLAEALCKAEDGGRGGICGEHLRLSRLALAHLTEAGLLVQPGDWRRRNGLCPDPAGHERANANNDEVIRLKAAGRYMPVRAGWCDYCGFRVTS